MIRLFLQWLRDREADKARTNWLSMRSRFRAEMLPERMPKRTFRFWAQDKLAPGQGSKYWWQISR